MSRVYFDMLNPCKIKRYKTKLNSGTGSNIRFGDYADFFDRSFSSQMAHYAFTALNWENKIGLIK
jgi:hypothetical protein